MTLLKSVFVRLYLIAMFAALIFALLIASSSPFAGVYLVILTLPWSYILVAGLDFFGIQDTVPVLLKILLLAICSIINAYFLYYIEIVLPEQYQKKES